MPPEFEALGDDDLVLRARGGSEEAMLELYRRYRTRIMGYAYRMTGDRTLAEDVFHTTFLYFFQHLERYESRGKLGAYLFRIARSAAVDEKVAGRRSREGPAPPAAKSRVESPSAEGSDADFSAKVREGLLKLSPDLREVATLRLYDGLDYAKIAELTGVSEATARSRMRYALESLRKHLT